MIETRLLISSSIGLHARPAAIFSNEAAKYQSEIKLRNYTTNSDWVDAKSTLGVLTLWVESNHEIDLKASGHDESKAVAALTTLVQSNFGETQSVP